MDQENKVSTEADAELLGAMLFELERYESGGRHFPAMVSALDAGISALSDSQSSFREELLKEWWVLEEINALALDIGSLEPLQEHVVDAKATIQRLKVAIRAKLSSPPGEDER